jgi:hypothetical protein
MRLISIPTIGCGDGDGVRVGLGVGEGTTVFTGINVLELVGERLGVTIDGVSEGLSVALTSVKVGSGSDSCPAHADKNIRDRDIQSKLERVHDLNLMNHYPRLVGSNI